MKWNHGRRVVGNSWYPGHPGSWRVCARSHHPWVNSSTPVAVIAVVFVLCAFIAFIVLAFSSCWELPGPVAGRALLWGWWWAYINMADVSGSWSRGRWLLSLLQVSRGNRSG